VNDHTLVDALLEGICDNLERHQAKAQGPKSEVKKFAQLVRKELENDVLARVSRSQANELRLEFVRALDFCLHCGEDTRDRVCYCYRDE